MEKKIRLVAKDYDYKRILSEMDWRDDLDEDILNSKKSIYSYYFSPKKTQKTKLNWLGSPMIHHLIIHSSFFFMWDFFLIFKGLPTSNIMSYYSELYY